MTLEQAIQTAIEYETKIRDIYFKGLETIQDEVGKRIIKMLGDDEQHHVDYLKFQLEQWQQAGKIDSRELTTDVPSKANIERAVDHVKDEMTREDRGVKQQLLSKALKAEVETSDFYKRMVSELPPEGQALFERFLEIEDNHISTVQFELDYISQTGYWFDVKEFDME